MKKLICESGNGVVSRHAGNCPIHASRTVVYCLLASLGLLFTPMGEAHAIGCDVKLAAYKKAWRAYNRKANSYWAQIKKKKSRRKTKKRKGRPLTRKDYVLSHPPVYNGPKYPKCAVVKKKKPSGRKKKSTIGVVADFLREAKRKYGFVPRPTTEKEYKRIYATEALALGLTAEQVIGVYSLETGGIGPYNRQSGIFPIDYKCRPLKKPKGRPASTALGYAQLLGANTLAMVKEHGHAIAKRLEFSSLMMKPQRKQEMQRKAKILRRMVRDVKVGIRRYKNRNNWREFKALARTPTGYAIHALNLDPDIGPLIQVQKLKKIVSVAEKKGFTSISSAQLETMNLAGWPNGLEMMSAAGGSAPSSNFFTRNGYRRNPVAKNVTGAELIAKIGDIIAKRKKNCGALEFIEVFQQVSTN